MHKDKLLHTIFGISHQNVKFILAMTEMCIDIIGGDVVTIFICISLTHIVKAFANLFLSLNASLQHRMKHVSMQKPQH